MKDKIEPIIDLAKLARQDSRADAIQASLTSAQPEDGANRRHWSNIFSDFDTKSGTVKGEE